jgi:hypothetical protein
MARSIAFPVTDYSLTTLGAFGGALRGWIELTGSGAPVGYIYLVDGPLPDDYLGGSGSYIVMHQPASNLENLLSILRNERSLQIRLNDGSTPPSTFLETGSKSIGAPAQAMKVLDNFRMPPAPSSGTWRPLANQPSFPASTMLLLTDGTAICQESFGRNWWGLSPDANGDYVNGTWSRLPPMKNSRLYYASAVLKDGRVFVSGGEDSDAGGDTTASEIYDPVANTWQSIPGPTGWTTVGDASSCVLADGRVMIGALSDPRTAIFDPTTDSWSAGPNMAARSNEETWTLLPDGTVVTASCANHPRAEKYVPGANQWVSAGILPVDLVEASSIEIGPAVLLPDGRLFAVGATGHTALYNPPAVATTPGTWIAGPDFPPDGTSRQLAAKDAPGCLLPNGHVLCAVGPVDGVAGNYDPPTYFFEFDGMNLLRVNDPPNSTAPPFDGRMLLLPTGQVLFAASSAAIYVYDPTGSADLAWTPTITSVPLALTAAQTYRVQGTQFNGLSQAVSYGDDVASATNYPLVRIRNANSGHIRHCRTFKHSSMGVATGTAPQSTEFEVPADIETGPSHLYVIANGIPSPEVAVTVA